MSYATARMGLSLRLLCGGLVLWFMLGGLGVPRGLHKGLLAAQGIFGIFVPRLPVGPHRRKWGKGSLGVLLGLWLRGLLGGSLRGCPGLRLGLAQEEPQVLRGMCATTLRLL